MKGAWNNRKGNLFEWGEIAHYVWTDHSCTEKLTKAVLSQDERWHTSATFDLNPHVMWSGFSIAKSKFTKLKGVSVHILCGKTAAGSYPEASGQQRLNCILMWSVAFGLFAVRLIILVTRTYVFSFFFNSLGRFPEYPEGRWRQAGGCGLHGHMVRPLQTDRSQIRCKCCPN